MKAILIDDEENARQALKSLLELYFPEVSVLAQCEDVPSGVRAINSFKPNLVFLDIDMPGYSGLRLIEFFSADQLDFQIVFITAYNQYAVQAFEMSALDYILKPVGKDDLGRAISKAKKLMESESMVERMAALKVNLTNDAPKRIAVPSASGYNFVAVDQLMRLQSDGPYTHLVQTNGEKMMASRTLKEFDDMLQTNRPHKCFLLPEQKWHNLWRLPMTNL